MEPNRRTCQYLSRCALLLSASCFSILAHCTQAAAQEFIILRPDQVNCSEASETQPVENSEGFIQSTAVFCGEQAETRQVQVQTRQADENSVPWGSPYWVDEMLCRERGITAEIVCLSPQAAFELNWTIPSR